MKKKNEGWGYFQTPYSQIQRTNEQRPPAVKIRTSGVSMTVQESIDECNVNKIMERYKKTGVIEHVRTSLGQYGDFHEIPDFQESLNQIKRAEEMFMQLPATVREKFQNDPYGFVEFAMNPENAEHMITLGLAEKRESNPPKADSTPKTPAEGGTPPA